MPARAEFRLPGAGQSRPGTGGARAEGGLTPGFLALSFIFYTSEQCVELRIFKQTGFPGHTGFAALTTLCLEKQFQAELDIPP